jgi:hypothetical protein
VNWRTSPLPIILPSIPRLKLSRAALEATGFSDGREAQILTRIEKYEISHVKSETAPLPLGTVYHLHKPSSTKQAAPLTALDVTSLLRKSIYPGTEVCDPKLQRTIFEASAFLATNVPNQLLSRGHDLEQLQELADQVLERTS